MHKMQKYRRDIRIKSGSLYQVIPNIALARSTQMLALALLFE